MPSNLEKVYESASKYYSLPDLETFKKDMQNEANLKSFYNNVSKHYSVPEFEQFKSDMRINSTGYQWSSATQSNYNVVEGVDKVTGEQEVKTFMQKNPLLKKEMEQPSAEDLTLKAKQKEDEALLKSSQVNLNISNESLAREGEYGVNRSTYGNTQRLVNNYQQSKALLNDPNTDGDLLKEDVINRLKSIEAKKIELEASKKQKEHFINERWNGQNSYDELAKVNKEYQNQINELNNTFLDLKQLYTSPEQRVKYNPLLKLIKEDSNVLAKLTQEQWDKFVSD